MLVISEEWSSDCRRDIPVLKRLAEAGGLDLRIFRRDGQRFSQSHRPSLTEAPDSNADIMAEFLNEKKGQTWQSIPVAVFYTADLDYLYHYIEVPRIYDKDRLVYGHIRVPRPGETPDVSLFLPDLCGPTQFIELAELLAARGHPAARIDKILGGNFRRVMDEAWQ